MSKKADLAKQPEQVSAMFDEVAERYDITNDVLSFGNDRLWRIALRRAVDPRPGDRVLDLAAGTGTSSAALAATGATVVAADFSPGMIAEGRRRFGHLPNIDFVEADATNLPFGDDEFDAVTISFGLRNVVDPKKALAEMLRVTKPGGRLVVCEFSTPPAAAVRSAYNLYIAKIMPLIVRLVSSNSEAYTYLNDSIRAWPNQKGLARWLREAGWGNVEYRNLTAGIAAMHRAFKPAG
ncbi:demethylmenaquinone methyltransferase [Paramicrobacterium agarici]|uniref:demethylmenaquinone methyltransferase n=1 Tax=Paramicrobacterium agarici TaxID=630514 RepID=UPI00114F5F11|nr:demethylmenaquinone methyltransferase [Microbacterium agarici]TQO22405.1 demethylmenaquinone methyltransferase/2-methoxy-6-polyprenyl-1,4-benzoquinol methylase [Microbacterium agarici]